MNKKYSLLLVCNYILYVKFTTIKFISDSSYFSKLKWIKWKDILYIIINYLNNILINGNKNLSFNNRSISMSKYIYMYIFHLIATQKLIRKLFALFANITIRTG